MLRVYLTLLSFGAVLVNAQIVLDGNGAVVCPLGYNWENGKCSASGLIVGPPVCPADYYWNGNQCELAVCPNGFTRNPVTGVCERVTSYVSVGPATCPSGYYYNSQRSLCYPNNPCAEGLIYSNGRCEIAGAVSTYALGGSVGIAEYAVAEAYDMSTSVMPVCQSGYTYNSVTGSCETTIKDSTDPTCQRGSLVNGQCVYQQTQQPSCPSGYSYENGQCVRKRYVAATSCPAGFTLDGSVCRSSEQVSPKCPYNTELRGNECVRIESTQPSCSFGSIYRNGRCETSTTSLPTCPPDHEYVNGNCVRIIVNAVNCPAGYEFDRGTCVRKVVIPLECPPGYTMQSNRMCSRLEIRTPLCPRDAQLEGSSCVYIEYIAYNCPMGYNLNRGICERDTTEPPRCPAEYKLNYEGKCEKIIIYRPPVTVIRPQPTATPIRLTCPTVGPVPPCPGCPEKKCETASSCQHNCPVAMPPQVALPPINNYVYNNNTINSPVNVTSVNTNTITITSASNCRHGTKTVKTGEGSSTVIHQECIEDKEEESEIVQIKAKEEKCCTVVGPRQCQRRSNDWKCFHRRHHRCGEFCSKETIQLRPARPMYRQNMLVMPPPPQPVIQHMAYVQPMPMMAMQHVQAMPVMSRRRHMRRYDCSTCMSSYQSCPAECYEYSCEGGSCEYMDQSSFCSEYGGEGCSTGDGCLEGEGCYDE